MTPEQALAIIANWERADGRIEGRVLPDGSVALLGPLIYTTAIYTGVSMWGNERRFCYADPALARAEFEALQGEDVEPSGWIARR